MSPEQIKEVAKQVEPIIQQWAVELLEWAKTGKGFVTEQAPLIAQEVIRWGITSAAIRMIIGIIAIVVGWKFSLFIERKRQRMHDREEREIENGQRNSYSDLHSLHTLGIIIGRFLIIPIGTLLFFAALLDGVKALVVPRIYLIEYLTTLVK